MTLPTPKIPGLGWLPLDKQGHVAAGAIIACCGLGVSGLASYKLGLNVQLGVWLPMVPVLIAAVGKELYDARHRDKHTPDVWDAVATTCGGLVPCIVAQMVVLGVRWLA